MQPSITAKELALKVMSWPTNGDPVFVTWEHGAMSRKIRLFKDERGVTMQCRCQVAVRMFYPHPTGRDDCCSDCRRKVQAMFDRREAWGSSRKRKPVEKVEISTDKPADVSGSQSKDRPLKKISTNKKGQPSTQISTATNATRLQKAATDKKGAPKRRRTTGQKPARKAA